MKIAVKIMSAIVLLAAASMLLLPLIESRPLRPSDYISSDMDEF